MNGTLLALGSGPVDVEWGGTLIIMPQTPFTEQPSHYWLTMTEHE